MRIGDAPVFPADEALLSSHSFAPTYLSSFHLSLPVLDPHFPYLFFQKKRSVAYSQYSTSACIALALASHLSPFTTTCATPGSSILFAILHCFNVRALDSDNPRSLTIDAKKVIGFSNAGWVVAKVFPNTCAVERTPG